MYRNILETIFGEDNNDSICYTLRSKKKERGVIMTIEEILAGESKNVEFKENLPERSIKYMKSVLPLPMEPEVKSFSELPIRPEK